MTQEMLESGSGSTPQNLLTEDILNKMGRELVRLCDRMEQHGLVDYQMGVWEEEILSGEYPNSSHFMPPRFSQFSQNQDLSTHLTF